MKRATLLYAVAAAALLLLLLQVFTGFVLWVGIPLGIGRGDWVNIHRASAMAFLVMMGVHLNLNQRWIASVTKSLLPAKGKPAGPANLAPEQHSLADGSRLIDNRAVLGAGSSPAMSDDGNAA